MAEDERYGCLEWARLPDRRGEYDEQVEEEAKNREGSDNNRDSSTEIPHISSQSVSEEEKGKLHGEGEALHDKLEAPGDHPPHPELPMAAAVDERSLDVEIEPLFPQHGQECGEECAREGAE